MNSQMIPASAEVKTMSVETANKEQLIPQQIVANIFGDMQQFENAQRMAKLLSVSDCVPESYKGKLANCTIAIDIANRMDLSPLTVMQNLYIVRGKPSWSGQACRALIQNNGKFKDDDIVYVGTRNTDDWGCYMTAVNIKTGAEVKGPTVTIGMAKKEGWYSKKDKNGNETSKWQTMPELMLAYRAAAFFARVHCPSAMMGFQTTEEIIDVTNADKQNKINSITADILGGTS